MRHKFIVGRAGDLLGMPLEEAEDCIIDSADPAILAKFEEYFKPDGLKILLFYSVGTHRFNCHPEG